MATTPGALNKAILARLRGTEVLTGTLLTAQGVTSAIPWRLGALRKDGVLPCGVMYEDAGMDANQGRVGVGIQRWSIRRFELWTQSRDESGIEALANALELLLDTDRGATLLSPTGDGVCWEMGLFTDLQFPIEDDERNAFVGLMSFKFLESRP